MSLMKGFFFVVVLVVMPDDLPEKNAKTQTTRKEEHSLIFFGSAV